MHEVFESYSTKEIMTGQPNPPKISPQRLVSPDSGHMYVTGDGLTSHSENYGFFFEIEQLSGPHGLTTIYLDVPGR